MRVKLACPQRKYWKFTVFDEDRHLYRLNILYQSKLKKSGKIRENNIMRKMN